MLLRTWTDRQFRTVSEWIQQDLNKPGKVEAYLMRVAQAVVQVACKNPEQFKLEDFKVVFSVPEPPPTLEQAAAWHRAKWSVIYDMQPKRRR